MSDRRGSIASVTWGALAGAGAFLAGYLFTYVWKAPAVNDAIRGVNLVAELLGAEVIPTWKAVGWLFYGEHFVATLFPTFGGDTMVNLVGRGDGTDVLYVLPPVLLLVAGAVTARAALADETGEAAVRGASTVIGYLPLAAFGVFVTAHEVAGSGRSIAPDLVAAVLLAGVVYPLAFGGLGGVIASLAIYRLHSVRRFGSVFPQPKHSDGGRDEDQ